MQNGLRQETVDGELVKYDAKDVSSAASLWRLRGTVLASKSLWLHVFLYFLTAAAVCGAVSFLSEKPELIRAAKVREVVDYFSLFVAVALAYHISLAVDRWWEMRTTMLGGLWCAVDDLTMILAAHFPSREHRRLKTLVLRYCLLSVELLFMQARGGEEGLNELVQRHLLREDEREKLEHLPNRPQVVWVWIAGIFQRLAEGGKLPSRLLSEFYGICTRGRSAIGGVCVHLDTQLPFSYVHLISAVVHANNFMVAAKCGTVAAVALRRLRMPETEKAPISDAENFQVLLLQLFALIAIPVVTLGLLEVGVLISDPLGSALAEFPRSALHVWMRDECEAFQTTAEEAPGEIAIVADGVEIKDACMVHDCVHIV